MSCTAALQDGKPEFAYAYSNQIENKYWLAFAEQLAADNHVVRVKSEYSIYQRGPAGGLISAQHP